MRSLRKMLLLFAALPWTTVSPGAGQTATAPLNPGDLLLGTTLVYF